LNKNVLVPIVLIMSVAFAGCVHTSDAVDYAVGDISEKMLLTGYKSFATNYQSFEIKTKQKEQVKLWPANLKIEAFLGTWCHDSQREVPHLLKVLQGNEQVELVLIALDYQKSEPHGRAKLAQIKYTPTFVVSLDGKEVGRIIERPKKSLVDDISAMLVTL
jgi:thiol-disulfide isomerase/thioredoxin